MRDDPGCTGKTGYLSWAAADKALSRNRFRPDARYGRIGAYRCRRCHEWHIGKSVRE